MNHLTSINPLQAWLSALDIAHRAFYVSVAVTTGTMKGVCEAFFPGTFPLPTREKPIAIPLREE